MTRYLLSIFLLFICLSVFFSCEKTDDDNEKPSIEILEISDIMYIDSIDSSINRIKVIFADNKALASYKICFIPSAGMIDPDSVIQGGGNKMDSLALNSALKSQKINIFDSIHATVSQSVIIPARITRYEEKSKTNETYAVRTGKYTLSVVCIDKAGNYDSISVNKDIILRNSLR